MLKRTKGEKIFAVFNYIGMVLLSLIFLIPVWHVLMGSLSDPLKISAHTGIILYPLGKATLGGYKLVMQNNFILRSYANTILVVVASTGIGTFLTILASYVMSVKGLYWKKPFNFLITFTMIFNGGLIPTYVVVRNLHMMDTYWSLIIPGCCIAYNIIIMRTSFSQIPDALSEAATIDGANRVQKITHITLPCIMGTVTVMLVMNMGNILSNGFEQIWLLQNALNKEVAEVLETYSYQVGLKEGRYSFATAVGLFQSLVGLIMIFGSNALSKRMGGGGLW